MACLSGLPASSRLGYFGVATLAFLEHLFPPIPSELVIPLAGFVAAQGDLRLTLVIVMGSVGSLAGALVWYGIGKRVGEQRLRTWVADRDDLRTPQRAHRLVAMDGDEAEVGIDVLLPRQRQDARPAQLRRERGDRHLDYGIRR